MGMHDIKQWAVIGAGAAGLLAVGKLIDSGVPAQDILWCDPSFQCGDLGQYWHSVPSNTTVKLFEDSFNSVACLDYGNIAASLPLSKLDQQDTCLLGDVVEILQVMTDKLVQQVTVHKGLITQLSHQRGGWCLSDNDTTIAVSKSVILAIGSNPSSLDIPSEVPCIRLYDALVPEKLQTMVQPNETVAVFGSSHSAVLCIKACIELGAKVIQFYRDPIRFACPLKSGETLFNDTGLKGDAAQWARDNLFDNIHPSITQLPSTQAQIATALGDCHWQIQAVGLQPKHTIEIEGIPWPYAHEATSGILAPGLFGLGIAFPEKATDSYGHTEYRVGLLKFVHKLEKYLALWQAYQ